MKFRVLFIVLMTVLAYISYAQKRGPAGPTQGQGLIDSLQARLAKTKDDTNKVNLLNLLSESYGLVNTDKGLEMSAQANNLAERLHYELGKADAIKSKARNYYIQGKLKEALALYRQSMTMGEKLHNPLLTSQNLLGIGNCYMNLSDYPNAISSFDSSMKICQRLGSKTGVVANLANLANVYFYMSDYTKSLSFSEQALAGYEETGDQAGIAHNLSSMALVYNNQSNYPKAMELFQRSLDIDEAIGNKSGMANTLWNMGIVQFNLANYQKSVEYYTRAMKINQELGDKKGIANNLQSFGNVYSRQSDYPKALGYFQQALNIHEETGNRNGTASCLHSIGNLYLYMEDYRNARDYFQKALDLSRQLGRSGGMASSLNNLGEAYKGMGDYTRALDYYNQSLVINTRLERKTEIANNLGNIASVQYELKDYSGAMKYYHQALVINRAAGKKSGMIYNLKGIGKVYAYAPDSLCGRFDMPQGKSRLDYAITYADSALQIAKETENPGQQMETWQLLSDLYVLGGQYPQAFEAYKKYTALHDTIENADKQKRVARMEVQYDFDKKEAAYKFEKQLNEEKLLRQAKDLELQQQTLQLVSKEKDLQHLEYLNTQVLLDVESGRRKANEKELILTRQEKDLQAAELNLQKAQLALKEKELHAKMLERNLFLVSAVLVLGVGGYAFQRFRQRKRAENRQALLDERMRLSRDLHDDIGSTLGSISIYSEVAAGKLKRNEAAEVEMVLQKMGDASRFMSERMSDIVWSINPENDQLLNITDRMKTFASMMLRPQGIDYKFAEEGVVNGASLTIGQRKNLFFIYKEAINNIVKYAGCSKVVITVSISKRQFCLRVEDDGQGFDSDHRPDTMGGNGIRNMTARARDLNGALDIESSPKTGTTVTLMFPV